MIGEGANVINIDPMRIISKPTNAIEVRSNIIYVFTLLRTLKIEVVWDVMDWITYPDTDFVLLQLFYIYDALKARHCSLAPAMGNTAGVTSGPNGEPLVVGMIFCDTMTVTVSTTGSGPTMYLYQKFHIFYF